PQRPAAHRPRPPGAGRPQLLHGPRPRRGAIARRLGPPRQAAPGGPLRRPAGAPGGVRLRAPVGGRFAPAPAAEAPGGGGDGLEVVSPPRSAALWAAGGRPARAPRSCNRFSARKWTPRRRHGTLRLLPSSDPHALSGTRPWTPPRPVMPSS